MSFRPFLTSKQPNQTRNNHRTNPIPKPLQIFIPVVSARKIGNKIFQGLVGGNQVAHSRQIVDNMLDISIPFLEPSIMISKQKLLHRHTP